MAGATLTAVTTENATSVAVDDDRFEVADGNLKLKDDMSLDFEGDDGGSVDVTITASGDGASATHTVAVTINDVNEGPSLDAADGAVDEEADGATVGAVTASDPDAGDTHTFTVSDDRFEVADGMLKLKDGMALDYETEQSVMMTITVTDAGGLSASSDVTVTINAVNEAPEAAADSMVSDAVFVGGEENSMTVDLKALFSDPDGDRLTYKLSDNAPDWLTFSVTTSGSGADQTITGTMSGTPPADMTDSIDGVSIIAMDDGGMSAEATFDIVVDAANAAPTRVDLRVTEDDGVVVRVTAVEVDENAKGAVLGSIRVHDADDARHPHGQHDFTFEVDGKADDRFEVADGMLKLKDDASLNHEAGAEITVKITATDRYVTAPGDDEDPTAGSASQSIKITVKDVAAGDGPVGLKTIGDWWVTVDDNLDAEDVRAGDWLSFGLDTTGSDAAFTDEDGDDLSYAISVVDSGGRVVDWLQISNSGKMTNKAGMLPERGVYTVTVTATDEGDNSAQISFTLAVALSDDNHRDNDTPDIRDVEDFDYTEGSGAQKVASFSIRDEDVAIAPHPYGVMDVSFTATQNGANVANRLKIVEVGRDEDSVHYEVWTKSAAELAVDDKGKALPDAAVPKPLDFENGDEVDITVTVRDGKDIKGYAGEEDDKDITFDLVDAADEAPAFQSSAVGSRADGVTRSSKDKTTTITVKQESDDKYKFIVPLSEAWEDEDTDDDELDFSVGGHAGLPSWIKVYGPNEWEDLYEGERGLDRGDAPSTVRDRDIVFAVVIDRSTMGDNDGLTGGSFTVTAEDADGNSATETIKIEVDDINTNIATADEDKVVSINGDPRKSTAPLTMDVDLGLDPDLRDADDAVMVVYTWSHDNATPDNADDDVTTTSSTPQPFALVNPRTGAALQPVGTKITATVQYYEIDPVEKTIIESKTYTDTANATVEPDAVPQKTGVSFEVTTDTTGVAVAITATGDAKSSSGNVKLQASSNGQSGWLNVDTGDVDTSGTDPVSVTLDVNANADGSDGDGGGLYYRVVYSYTDDGKTQTESYDVGQLGDVTGGDPTNTTPAGNIIGGGPDDNPDVNEVLRVANGGNDAEVQWQIKANANAPWSDIDGATHLELEVDAAYAGKMLRAKVTYTDDDNPTTPNANEDGWPIWIEYTEVLTVSGADVSNDLPAATQTSDEFEVELAARPPKPATGDQPPQPTKIVTYDASGLFFDPDNDDLTYSITAAPNLDADASSTTDGRDSELDGNAVYRVYTTEEAADTADPDVRTDIQQSLWIDKDTGEITYFTDLEQGHDGNSNDGSDGGSNTLTFTISATDNDEGTTSPPTATVTVRVNVAPTAISLQSIQTDGITNEGTAAPLPAPGKGVTGTPLVVEDNANSPADDDNLSDLLTFTDDDEQTARKVADINVADQNASSGGSHGFGTHKITLSGRGADMFEARETNNDDNDGSTWEIWLKDDATFDFEALRTSKEKTDKATSIELSITVTATDGGGLSTKGVFSVVVKDATTPDDPKAPPPPPAVPDSEVPGLEDDAEDSDDDGPVIPPDDGGMFIDEDDLIGLTIDDDLLGDYMLIIDDIDIA